MGRDDVFVNKDNMALIMCPHCGKMKHVSVAKFKNAKHSLQVKCACGQKFPVDLNFRSKFRKDTNLHGYYHRLSEKKPDPMVVGSNCTVVNLSLGGLGLRLTDKRKLTVGEEIGIEFVLDDKKKSEIKRRFIVRHVSQDGYVGGEFIGDDQNQYDKTLGFYLMP